MSAGAFSDDGVLRVVEKIVPVFVDCDWGKKNTDLSGKYGVKGYPTVILTDSEGNEVSKGQRDAAGLTKQIEDLAAKYTKAAAYAESWDKAVEQAKEEKKPVVYLFTTAKEDSKKLETALGDDSLKDLREKFVFVKSEIRKENEDAKKFQVASSSQPVILVLDPNLEKPESKILKKLSGKKSAKELKSELESALKKFNDGK